MALWTLEQFLAFNYCQVDAISTSSMESFLLEIATFLSGAAIFIENFAKNGQNPLNFGNFGAILAIQAFFLL